MTTYLLLALVCILVGYRIGWQRAHVVIAQESELLGKFYVGKTVYEIKSYEKKDKNEQKN